MIGSLNVVRNPLQNDDIIPDQLNKITNNYVKKIQCLCLDEFSLEQRNRLLKQMVDKLCVGGTLSLKFINLNLLSNKINRSELTGQKYSSILPLLQSCWSDKESIDVINNLSVVIQGLYYDNIYSIITLEKI